MSSASVRAVGSSEIKISSLQTGDFHVNGAGKIKIEKMLGGSLEVALLGSNSFSVKGEADSAKFNLRGASRLSSNLDIDGNLSVQAQGASQVIHTGKVLGRIDKKSSGASRIQISNVK